MFTGEVLRRNLKGNQISAGDYEYRLIRATHAVIAYADSLIIKNITNNELLRERNRMHHSRSKFNPNPADRWESSATLRVVCPSNTVVITSNLLFEPASATRTFEKLPFPIV